jgi:hypothetical protein
MLQYFDKQDNKPDAVSSAHWNDFSACSSAAPRLKAMCKLPLVDNPAPANPFKDTLMCSEYSFPSAIDRGNSQAHCNNITYQKTRC